MYSRILSFMIASIFVISCYEGSSMTEVLTQSSTEFLRRPLSRVSTKAHGETRPNTPVSLNKLPRTISAPVVLETETLQIPLFRSRISQFIQDVEQCITSITSEIKAADDADDARALMDIKDMNLKQKSNLNILMNVIKGSEINPQKIVTASQVFMECYNRIIWPFSADGRTPYADESTITRTKDETIIVAKFLSDNLRQANIPQKERIQQQLDSIIKAAQ